MYSFIIIFYSMQQPNHLEPTLLHLFNSSSTILMVRPANFGLNPETLADNAFQTGNTDKGD